MNFIALVIISLEILLNLKVHLFCEQFYFLHFLVDFIFVSLLNYDMLLQQISHIARLNHNYTHWFKKLNLLQLS